jgi:hypothetical protein
MGELGKSCFVAQWQAVSLVVGVSFVRVSLPVVLTQGYACGYFMCICLCHYFSC